MAEPIRVGKSRNHRERKNGASREQWMKRKAEANAARGLQVFKCLNDDPASGIYMGDWIRQ